MNRKKYEQTISLLTKAKLANAFKGVMGNAEKSWSAQRDAISLIDHKNDEVKGEAKLEELISSLNLWIISLEVLSHGAQKIAKRAHQAVHERGPHEPVEEDGDEHSLVEVGDKAPVENPKGAPVQSSTDRRTSRRRNGGRRADGFADKGCRTRLTQTAQASPNEG